MSEIELKFLFDESMARAFWTRVKALELGDGRQNTRTLRSIYLDTPEHALSKAGIALRLRRDGRRWIQTVKTGGQLHGGLSQIGEVENAAPGGRLTLDGIPDIAVRDQIVRAANGAPLGPVFETVVKRTAREVVHKNGTRAELALDVGEIRAGSRSTRLCEVEIELKEGSASGLFDIAQALFPDGGLRFSRLSKSARGYLLADEGYIEQPIAPRRAETVALDPALTAEQAARDILRECLDQIADNMLAVRHSDDTEGPHQLRIGLRRLRSAFSVYAPVLQSPEMARIGDEARWLGQEVGRLRDLDVVAKEIVPREAASHPDEPGLSALAEVLSQRAADLRKPLGELLAGPRAQTFVIDLARFVETRGWLVPEDFGQTERLAAPVAGLADNSLGKLWKKTRKRAHGLETLDVHQRHDLRKQLKKLRYAVEFFSPLYPPRRVDPFLKHLKNLQAVFGDLNDSVTVRAMLTGAEAPGAGDPSAQRAVGWVIGATQARAEFGWTGAKALWRDLEKTRLFWK